MRPDRRPSASDRLESRIQQVCSSAGTLIEYWGFKSILGRVWTLLFVRGQPLSQTEVADTLGVSKSLVSAAVNELAGYGLIRATEEHRNAPIEAIPDVWPVITDILRSREWMLLESMRMALEAAIEEASLHPGQGRYDLDRMRILVAMVASVQRLLRLVMSIRMPDSVQGVKDWVTSVTRLIESMRGV